MVAGSCCCSSAALLLCPESEKTGTPRGVQISFGLPVLDCLRAFLPSTEASELASTLASVVGEVQEVSVVGSSGATSTAGDSQVNAVMAATAAVASEETAAMGSAASAAAVEEEVGAVDGRAAPLLADEEWPSGAPPSCSLGTRGLRCSALAISAAGVLVLPTLETVGAADGAEAPVVVLLRGRVLLGSRP